jgi:nucleoid-associated protein YgaU
VTREHKLALIVGFALVLVVGIAISDHFSKARTGKPGTNLTAGNPDSFGATGGGLDKQIGPPEAPQVTPDRGTLSKASHEPDVITIDPQSGKAGISSADSAHRGADGSDRISDESHAREPKPLAQPEPMPAKPISRGTLRKYDVKPKDTLYKLAQSSYNDGRLWQELAEYNKGRIGPDNSLRLGTTLLIPPKDVLLGEAVLGSDNPGEKPAPSKPGASPGRFPTSPDISETAFTKAGKPAKKSATTTYTVKSGDHLSTIALRLLGSAKRVQDILELNSDQLDDADSIVVGTNLKIPAK